MLGQPISMLLPQVVGIELVGALPRGRDRDRPRAHRRRAAAQARRGRQVRRVLRRRRRARCRSRTGRRSATCRPSTARRARSSRSTTRRCATCASPAAPDDLVALVETYAKEQGLWHDPPPRPAVRRDDRRSTSSTVEPSLAGPARPQDRVSLSGAQAAFDRRCSRSVRETRRRRRRGRGHVPTSVVESFPAAIRRRPPSRCASQLARSRRRRAPPRSRNDVPGDARRRTSSTLDRRHVVIAAITSCTNTSNPSVMIAAGLLARNAVARGLTVAAVGEDVARARLARRHRLLRTRRPASTPLDAARLRRRRLRLHDVHRQLGAARARDLRGGQRRRPLGVRRCSPATATSRAASTPTAA